MLHMMCKLAPSCGRESPGQAHSLTDLGMHCELRDFVGQSPEMIFGELPDLVALAAVVQADLSEGSFMLILQL
eukprot:324487-Hanusia_phi.AAC.1